MEWFWHLTDRFQKAVANTALHAFSTADWIFLVVIIVGVIYGGRKGFSVMFGKLFEMVLISVLAFSFYENDAAIFLGWLPRYVAEPVMFFLLTVFLWVSITWCFNLCGKVFKIEVHGFLKTAGGMIFGALRMALLLCVIAHFLLFFPIEAVQRAFKPGRTFMGHTIARLVPDLRELISTPFHKPVARKIAGSVKGG